MHLVSTSALGVMTLVACLSSCMMVCWVSGRFAARALVVASAVAYIHFQGIMHLVSGSKLICMTYSRLVYVYIQLCLRCSGAGWPLGSCKLQNAC
jgi:hypothetical protein